MRSTIFIVALAAVLTTSCRDQPMGTGTPKPDAGGTVTTCSTSMDCNGRGICIAGICEVVTTCMRDDECAASGKVCHTTRGFCVQCDGRHTNECPQGQTCQVDFTCVSLGGTDGGTNTTCSGSCTDKSMCGTDQVCKNMSCCPPPSRCFDDNDCPGDLRCNGANNTCFGATSCNNDNDCNSQPGCGGGACMCVGGPPGQCLERQNACASDMDCWNAGVYDNKYCTLGVSPTRCEVAPACNSDAECTHLNLVCDQMQGSPSYHRCRNGMPCPTGNECNPATEVCDPRTMVCVGKNCINTPNFCMGTDVCDQNTGECVPAQMGSCTQDTDCPAGRYCDLVSSPGTCRIGCRDSSECTMGAVCNAQHQCQSASGALCGPCATDADCPGGTICSPLTMRCRELCATGMCVVDPNAMCYGFICGCGI